MQTDDNANHVQKLALLIVFLADVIADDASARHRSASVLAAIVDAALAAGVHHERLVAALETIIGKEAAVAERWKEFSSKMTSCREAPLSGPPAEATLVLSDDEHRDVLAYLQMNEALPSLLPGLVIMRRRAQDPWDPSVTISWDVVNHVNGPFIDVYALRGRRVLVDLPGVRTLPSEHVLCYEGRRVTLRVLRQDDAAASAPVGSAALVPGQEQS